MKYMYRFVLFMLLFFVPLLAVGQESYKVVVDFQYDDMGSFSEDGIAWVRNGTLYGFIDRDGKQIINCQFDNVDNFSYGYAAVMKGSKWGYIDRTGRYIYQCQFNKANKFSANGLCFIQQDGYAPTFFNNEGKVAFHYGRFDIDASPDGFAENGLIALKKGNRWGYVNNAGKFVIDARFGFAGTFASNGLALVEWKNKFIFINIKGDVVIENMFEDIGTKGFVNGYAVVKKNSKWGFIDQTGKLIGDCQFDAVDYFSVNHMAAVQNGTKWGFIDQSGKLVIDYQFDAVGNFSSNGLAGVAKNGKFGFIDQKGNLIIDYQFDNLSDCGFDLKNLAVAKKGSKWGCITTYLPIDLITEYLKTEITNWQSKGKFETSNAYRLRVNVVNRQKELDKLSNKAIQEVAKKFCRWENLSTQYDADNQTFMIKVNGLSPFYVKVPTNEAEGFDSAIKDLQFSNIEYALGLDNAFFLQKAIIINPHNTKKYIYLSTDHSVFTYNQYNLNLDPIHVNLPTTNNTSKVITEVSNISIGLSDVDVNIPTTKTINSHVYALIIGNEDYHTFQPDLSNEANVAFAVNDASIFKKYIAGTLGIPESNMKFLSNATSGQMNQAIAWINKLIMKEGGEAEVVVYYAGHGLPDEQTHESYIIPVDVSGTNLQSAIKLQTLYSKLTEYPSKKVTVFMDACFSGGSRGQGLLATRGVKVKPKDDMLTGNIVVFTSSTGEQSSLPFKDKQHGMFTYYLLKKMQETKGNISYNELYNYIKKEVDLNCLKVNNKEQTPSLLLSLELGDKWKDWTLKY